jgi:hypothetical protein
MVANDGIGFNAVSISVNAFFVVGSALLIGLWDALALANTTK